MEAIERGLKKFYTGKACKNGHTAMRYTVSGTCELCIAQHHKKTQAFIAAKAARTAIAFKDMHPDDIATLQVTAQALVAARSLSEGTPTIPQTSAPEVSSRVELIRRQLYGSAA
jgi:hypothetical protein